MVLWIHELKQGLKGLIIWTSIIVLLIVIFIFIFPQMKEQMEGVNEMFSSMGSFTEAFGMDKVNFGTLKGFYSVECANILGVGGAFFAALLGITAVAKEESLGTAEFLLSHPVSRNKILVSKLISIITQLGIYNLVVYVLPIFAMLIIGEDLFMSEYTLLNLAFLFLNLEIACICFFLSTCLKKGNLGIGFGLASVFYFINLLANVTEKAEFLKWVTPFGFADGGSIASENNLEGWKIMLSLVVSVMMIGLAFYKYNKKDIK